MSKINKENLAKEIEVINKRIRKIEDPENRSIPVLDGIVDIDEYIASPIRILWILKEVHDTGGGGWDLREMLEDSKTKKGIKPGLGHTFNPIAYATNGIFTDRNMEEIKHVSKPPEIIDDLRKIAVINLKKIPGGSRANHDELGKQYNLHKEIILDQIRVFSPRVIICGRTFKLIKKDLPLDNFEKKKNDIFDRYYSANQLIIDAYHPGQRNMERKQFCDSIINAVNNWKIK